MQIAIICSTKDPAGMNIREHLIQSFKKTNQKFNNKEIYKKQNKENFLTLYTTDTESIHCENIDKEIQADLFIFATKHQSKAEIPSLSAHSPGNWGTAEMGGKNQTLCTAPASFLKKAIITLEKLDTDYEIIQECTHHGPYLEKPVMFIEIGSTINQWKNKTAGKQIAETILKITEITPKNKAIIGIGGLHHCPNFKKITLTTDLALSHVCPKYNLQNLNENTLKQAIEKTQEKVEQIVLDWKGLGNEKQRITKLLDKLSLKYKTRRIKEFFK